MYKTYGVSKDLSYKFNNILSEEIEKRKEENDSDKLISDDNNNIINNSFNNSFEIPLYILKYKANIDELKRLKLKCN